MHLSFQLNLPRTYITLGFCEYGGIKPTKSYLPGAHISVRKVDNKQINI